MTAIDAHDDTTITDWLDNLYGTAEHGWLTLFSLDRTTGDRRTDWSPALNTAALAAEATKREPTSCVWFGVATRHEKLSAGKRGGDTDCAAIPGLWLDVDIEGPGHKGGYNLAADRDAAHRLVERFPLEPTVVIDSGGGIQAWWLFAELAELDDDARRLLQAWGATWARIGEEAGIHVDNVFDPARIMRLPGTTNRKEGLARPVTITDADWTRRYGADDIDQHLDAAPPAPTHRTGAQVPYIGPERPGDAYNARHTGGDVLSAAGFTLGRRDRNGEEHWVRPGKELRDGTSATIYPEDGHTTIWSDTCANQHPGVELRRPYDPFGLYAALNHGGNMADATRALRAQGYGAPRIDLDAAAADLARMAEPEPWGDPTPWPEPARLPDFPLHTLPDWVEPHAVAAAEARQVPVDLCAMLAIGALSAACTGRALVVVTDGWHEPVNLYLTVAMRSGAGKSPAEKAMVSWLRKWERDLIAAQTPAHDEASILAKMADKKYRKLTEGALAEASDVLNAARDAQTAKDAVPALPRLIIDDTTPEAVATLLAAHGERLAILSTEADLFDGLLRGNPAQRPNMNVYLKAWSGDEMRRDRKGGSEKGPESTILERPLLTVSATVQPSVLARVLTDGEMVSRGFAARFMFAAPDDIMGQRDQRLRFRSGDLATAANYETVATDLASRWNRWANPAHLRLGPDAAAMYEDFLVELEPHLAIGGDLEQLAEWVAKMVASVARYAGLLHLSEMGDAGELVAAETMVRAIDLGRYWLAHAAGVAATEADAIVVQARAILGWIAASGAESVTLRDINRGVRRPALGIEKAVDYVAPLHVLIDHGWVRPVDDGDWTRMVGVPRSPSPAFQILPSVVGKSPDAVYARSVQCRAMGERESLSLPIDTPPPLGAATLDTARVSVATPESPPVDNPGGEPPDVSPDDPADPTDWMTL